MCGALCPVPVLCAAEDQPGPSSFPAGCWAQLGLGNAAALSVLCPQERTTRPRAMW